MRLAVIFLWAGICFVPFIATAQAPDSIRPPVAAGEFYPEDGATLLTAVRRYFDAATVPERPGRLVAVIAPHAAYGFAGDVIAHAFKELKPGQYDRVVILAPSHFAPIEGCSIPLTDAFVTPLGAVPLDQEAIRKISYSTLISTRRLQYSRRSERRPTHEREYAVEVLLPFLQERLGQFDLVPILVGKMMEGDASFRDDKVSVVADALREILDERTLLVVSTDFTHYGTFYNYAPFDESVDIPTAIRGLDRKAFELILRRDEKEFLNFLEGTRVPICGKDSLLLLMKLLPATARGEVLAYITSGERTGQVEPSVSYGAVVFHDVAGTPPQSYPSRQLLPPQAVLERELAESRRVQDTPQPVSPVESTEPDETADE